jgi:peptidoglycan biosynthesis protein MviN/MurJ (putative lipid II flippase)
MNVTDHGLSDESAGRKEAPTLWRVSVTNLILLAVAVSTLHEDSRRRALAFGALATANAVFVYRTITAKIAADGQKHSMWISEDKAVTAVFVVALAIVGVATWAFSDLARGETAHAIPELVITLLLMVIMVFVVRSALKGISKAPENQNWPESDPEERLLLSQRGP